MAVTFARPVNTSLSVSHTAPTRPEHNNSPVWLESLGYSSRLIDIRGLSNILHLKSGLRTSAASASWLLRRCEVEKEFSDYELICLNSAEEYAANCLLMNGKVLVAAGFDDNDRTLEHLGYQTIALDMSEFQKMDGGLSCLSLRF